MGRRSTIPKIRIGPTTTAFNVEARDHLPSEILDNGYVRVFINRILKLAKLVFHSEYHEGDASTNNIRFNFIMYATASLYSFFKSTGTIPVYQSKIDPYTWYIYLDSSAPTTPIKNIITQLITNLDTDRKIEWEHVQHNIQNKRKDMILGGVTYTKSNNRYFPHFYLTIPMGQFLQYLPWVVTKSIYFDIDETLHKVVIKTKHPLGYAHALIMCDTKAQGHIALPVINSVFKYYGIDLIDVNPVDTPSNTRTPYYFKVIPHLTEEGVYVVDKIYTTRSCMINSTTCE